MPAVQWLLEFLKHPDVVLGQFVAAYGSLVYLFLFVVIFCETGLVVTPFLPGDSLLFAAGAIAAVGGLDFRLLWAVLLVAAIGGDNSNYWIGRTLGPRVLKNENSRILRKSYLDRTRGFFNRHGAKTIVLARFVPIVRTFAPFLAGIGSMRYRQFLGFSLVGGFAWITLFTGAGYIFGNVPAVQHNFTLVVLGIVAVSLLPPLVEWGRSRFGRKAAGEGIVPEDR
jgi:membrane-associated protein